MQALDELNTWNTQALKLAGCGSLPGGESFIKLAACSWIILRNFDFFLS